MEYLVAIMIIVWLANRLLKTTARMKKPKEKLIVSIEFGFSYVQNSPKKKPIVCIHIRNEGNVGSKVTQAGFTLDSEGKETILLKDPNTEDDLLLTRWLVPRQSVTDHLTAAGIKSI